MWQEEFKYSACDSRAPSMASTRAPSCMSMSSPSPCASRGVSPAPSSNFSVWQPLTKETSPPPQKGKKGKKAMPPAQENEVTLMIRHLPLHYTPASLLQEIQAFMPNIDFFYLPTNFEAGNNLG